MQSARVGQPIALHRIGDSGTMSTCPPRGTAIGCDFTAPSEPSFFFSVVQILDMYEGQDVVKSNATGAQADNADDDWEL